MIFSSLYSSSRQNVIDENDKKYIKHFYHLNFEKVDKIQGRDFFNVFVVDYKSGKNSDLVKLLSVF